MRCEDVTRELAAPTGSISQLAISSHLADCVECAQWAERDAKLDRIWDLTRPEALSPETWDSVWANAVAALDHAPAMSERPDVLPFRRRTVWLVAIAQVAAAAIAIVCLSPPGPRIEKPGTAVAVVPTIEVDQGVVPVIQFDSHGNKLGMIELASASLEFINELEGSAGEGNVVQ